MSNYPYYGILGVCQHQIKCLIGIYPKERQQEQILMVDIKIKIDLSACLASGEIKDTVDYALIAELCTELAKTKNYLLLETFANDLLNECNQKFHAVWAWTRIQKPAAIATAAYAYVEFERSWERG